MAKRFFYLVVVLIFMFIGKVLDNTISCGKFSKTTSTDSINDYHFMGRNSIS